MAKQVLVCGATGFIGRNMVERLAENLEYEVTAVHLRTQPFQHPKLRWVKADLTQSSEVKRVFEETGAEILIHAAATTSGAKDIVQKPYYHVTDNALMRPLLFREAFDRKLQHVVFFSCTVMYASGTAPVKETDFDGNREMHRNYFGVGWTKVYLEKMAEFFARLGPTRYTVLRHSNIYGPWDKFDLERSHVFGATMTKVLSARDGKVMVWGDGSEERDLLYISDLVDFVEIALKQQTTPFELTNVGLGRAVSVAELVRKVIEASGESLRIEYDTSKPSLKTKICLDIAKARKDLGWAPRVSLEEGIRKTMEWYRRHLNPATGLPTSSQKAA